MSKTNPRSRARSAPTPRSLHIPRRHSVGSGSSNEKCTLLLNRAKCAIELRMYRKARNDSRSAIEVSPRPRAFYLLGVALREMGMNEDATKIWRQGLKACDSGDVYYYSKMSREVKTKKTEKKTENDMILLGNLHVNEGRYDIAIEIFSEILQNNRNNAQALLGRGTAYALKRSLESALRDFSRECFNRLHCSVRTYAWRS